MATDLEQVSVEFEEGFEEIRGWLRCEGYENYKEARRLCEEETREDPENDPFRSRYAAREIFSKLKAKLESLNQSDDAPSEKMKVLTATLDFQLGINFIETEELSTGEEHLLRCLDMLSENRLDRRCCSTVLQGLNQLGILWSRRGDPKKALEFLQDGEKVYHMFKKEIGGSPFGLHE